MSRIYLFLCTFLLALCRCNAIAAAPPTVGPEGPIWSAGAGFQFESHADKKRESLSGIACPPVFGAERRCVAAFDEGGEARYAVIAQNHLIPEPDRIVLLPGHGELDAEGAARDGNVVYVTGSHSPKRHSCQSNPDSRHVFRFKVDGASGRATLDGTGRPADLEDDQGRLWTLLTTNPVLQPFVGNGKCLGKPDHAVNIEGIAAKDGMLYFGFREPAKDKHAYILPVPADALFTSPVPDSTPFTVEVGQGRGIRDLLGVPEGVLLLIGPDDDSEDTGWSVGLWDGSRSSDDIRPRLLANLALGAPNPCKPPRPGERAEVKPEAFALIENSTDFWRFLILSDGMCDGGATPYRITQIAFTAEIRGPLQVRCCC
jgi:hypothetical protein